MKSFAVLLLFVVLSPKVFSQGAWDIKYFPVDKLSSTLIGKEIRIVFKQSNTDTITKSFDNWHIRTLFKGNDTVSLKINDIIILFKEDWKIYPDNGILRDQRLIGISNNEEIKEIYLESLSNDRIMIRCNFRTKDEKEYHPLEVVVEIVKIKAILTSM